MKKILFILLFFFSATVLAQTETNVKIIDKGIYKIEYSEFFKNPLKVTYTIYHTKSSVDRKGGFYAEPGVKTATNKDFESNAYDKGHMAPAETFSDTDEHMHLTFTYANCAVQHFKLNRGLWKILENLERQYSQKDSVMVINTVIFEKPYKQLVTGAYVPSKFRKEIILLTSHIKYVYEFPNDETTHSILDYERKDLEK